MKLVRMNFFWPQMDSWIWGYVGSCKDCQKDKAICHTQYGLLQPLEVPYAPWDSISMDFITDLPLSNGHDSIWVIVDRFTKMAHFVPLKSDAKKAPDLAQIFLREAWQLHGLPSNIVSDRDARFTSKFWETITGILKLKRGMSTELLHLRNTSGGNQWRKRPKERGAEGGRTLLRSYPLGSKPRIQRV